MVVRLLLSSLQLSLFVTAFLAMMGNTNLEVSPMYSLARLAYDDSFTTPAKSVAVCTVVALARPTTDYTAAATTMPSLTNYGVSGQRT